MVGISADAALKITNAIHEMLHCMDEGTSESCERFANLFTEDGEINIPMVKVAKKGRTELYELCHSLHKNFSPCTHWEGNLVLSSTDERIVTNKSYWKAIKNGEFISVGTHEDEFVLMEDDKSWKCRKRTIKHTWTKQAGNIVQK